MSTPAFPISALVYNEDGKDPTTIIHDGMTLRDYFAAKALQGIMVDPMMTMSADKIADWAYEMADAMLKAREV
jgi:hypothetical protein